MKTLSDGHLRMDATLKDSRFSKHKVQPKIDTGNANRELLVQQRTVSLDLHQNAYELTVAHYVAAVKVMLPSWSKNVVD